jgi:DHA2 family multidrug resistance protein
VPVDYVGLGLLIVWVGALQIMLDRGKELEWFASSTIVGLAVVAAIGFVVFLVWELTSENPIVDLRIFRHRGFLMGVITLSFTFGTYFSSVVLIPLWLQTSIGYTASWAGYASALNGVFAVVMAPVVGRLIGKVDTRALVCLGVSWMAIIAFWRSHFTADASFWAIALPFLLQGIGVPFYFVSITSITLSSVEPRETASAAGLSNFLRTSSAAFATSIMTTLWENTTTAKRAEMVGHLNDLPGALGTLTANGLSPDQATGHVDRLVQVQATMLATNQLFLIMGLLFLFAASVVWLVPRPRRADGRPLERAPQKWIRFCGQAIPPDRIVL